MTPPSYRWARARDFALISTGAASFVLAALFAAGGIWFRALFVAALGAEPLVYAGGFLATAIGLGIAHTFTRPPPP